MKKSIVTRWAAAAAVSVASLVAIPATPAAAAPGNTNVVMSLYSHSSKFQSQRRFISYSCIRCSSPDNAYLPEFTQIFHSAERIHL